MQYRKLDRAGNEVSILGLGCMRLPVVNGDEGQIDEPRATRLLHAAIERGINYLDTAYPYHKGTSETFLGRALQGGLRQKVRIATKLPSWAVETAADFERYLNDQLERLQTEHIDFYLLHALKSDWWTKLYHLGVLTFLDRAIRDGRIGAAGFSFHDELPLFKRIVDAYDWSFCQIQYNYMDEQIQAGREGLDYAVARGLGVVVMEPLRGGHLARESAADVQALWNSAPVRRSPAEWALRWVWDHPGVTSVLSGMNDLDQVEENCRIANEALPESLAPEELQIVEQVKDKLRQRIKVPCTSCGYCLPCPAGVNIPRIFGIYNDRFIYGDVRFPHRIYTITMNATALASNCMRCGLCEKHCPQQIPIMDMLEESHRVLSEKQEE
ncbi:MAG: aldo/keto reductase [Syntrophotaleaceae bacterium]